MEKTVHTALIQAVKMIETALEESARLQSRVRRAALEEIEIDLPDDNNVMRHEYRGLTNEEKDQMELIKDLGISFWEAVDRIGDSREISVSLTKIEEAVMWATKHLTR